MSVKPHNFEKSDSSSLTFYQRHERTFGKAAVVLGLALTAISLGMMIGCLGSITRDGLSAPEYMKMDLSTKANFNNLHNEAIATLGIMPIVGGVVIACCGAAMQYRAHKREKVSETSREREQIKTSSQKVKNLQTVALMIGFFVAMVGAGMILSSSLLLKHQVPDIQNFIDKHPELASKLQANWLDPKIPKLRGLIAGGVFTTLAGGGLMFLSLTGYGFTSLREKYKIRGLMNVDKEIATHENEGYKRDAEGKFTAPKLTGAAKARIQQENEGF